MKKIAVIGYGYVGKAVVNLFKEHFMIVIKDIGTEIYINPKESGADITSARDDEDYSHVNDCDLAIICVPTPMGEDGKCDTSIVESVLDKLTVPLVLIKSTIPPGTTDELKEKFGKRIVFSPEYIGEGKYFVPFWRYPHPTDMKYHDFIIMGGDREDTIEALEYFKTVMGPHVHYIQTTTKMAELTKYMENTWGGMKVTFCNEFYEIAKAFGLDYNELRELFLMDGRTERMHTMVFEEKRGFGGKCYPKDINGIVKASERAGYDPKLLKQLLSSNDDFNKLNKT